MKKPDHFTRKELRAAIRKVRLGVRDRKLLAMVAAAGTVEFTYAPRGRQARLVDSTGGMTTHHRRWLHILAELGYVTERLRGCTKTVNLENPAHTWTFRLTAAGREAIS
jgi:hypothetical protein